MEVKPTTRTPRPLLVAAIIALAGFIIRLDIYIVSISLPSIAGHFHVGVNAVSYVMLAYLVALTSTLLLFGKLADRFGRRRLFLVGYVVFVAAVFVCGVAPNLATLVIARTVQGLGGAILFTCAFSLIPKVMPKEHVGRAFGIWTTAVALGITVGTPLGGILSGLASRRWIFLINVPLSVGGLILSWKVIPPKPAASGEQTGDSRPPGFDLPGTVLSVIGVLLLVLALNRGRALGWTSPFVLVALVGAAVFLVAFWVREKRCADPLLPPALLADRTFLFSILTAVLGFMLVSGNAFLLPFYLEHSRGLSPQVSGWFLLLYSVLLTVTSPRAGRMTDDHDPRLLGLVSMIAMTVGCAAFAIALGRPGLVCVIVFLLWLGAALGFFFPPNNRLAMMTAPATERGAAAGVYQTGANFGMVLGVCLFETVFTHTVGPNDLAAPRKLLDHGFRNAYLTGAVLCAVAVAIFAFSKKTVPLLNRDDNGG